jgi:hypothetical protein
MQQLDNIKELSFVVGNASIVSNMQSLKSLRPFSDEVIAFLDTLGKLVIKRSREYSDAATFGFWCRRSALLREKTKYEDVNTLLGRGIVFHSTPSNVAVNFAFSFAAGMLAGNANIVRLPAEDFPQVNIICEVINELLNSQFANLASYIAMIKYSNKYELNDIFSSICDVRVVWGGDGTIERMRKSSLKPRASEITFADRHSIAVINADKYLYESDKARVAQNFYNDTYFSDQNACTSPSVIFWLGEHKEEAKLLFWDSVHKLASEKYDLPAIQAVGKLDAFYRLAAEKDVNLVQTSDNLIMRINVSTLDDTLMDFKYNCGFYFEYDISELSEILPVCNERCQTMTYLGIEKEELERFLYDSRLKGIDRIVPMGQSMDFALVWDGHDLIRELTRKVTVI